MDYIELIKHRHSVRAYLSKPVPDEAVQAILAAANQAPSAGNLQAYEIYLVTRPSQRAALAQAAKGQEFLAQAPIVLVFCAHPKRSAQRYNQRGQTCTRCKMPRSPALLPCLRRLLWDWQPFGWVRSMMNPCIERSRQIRITCRLRSCLLVTRPNRRVQLRDDLSLTWCTSKKVKPLHHPISGCILHRTQQYKSPKY